MSTDKRTNCTHTQKLIAKQAGEYILMHMDKRITINEMAGLMHVSETQLKNSFRNYYGNSVYRYIRSKKMESAAEKRTAVNSRLLSGTSSEYLPAYTEGSTEQIRRSPVPTAGSPASTAGSPASTAGSPALTTGIPAKAAGSTNISKYYSE